MLAEPDEHLESLIDFIRFALRFMLPLKTLVHARQCTDSSRDYLLFRLSWSFESFHLISKEPIGDAFQDEKAMLQGCAAGLSTHSAGDRSHTKALEMLVVWLLAHFVKNFLIAFSKNWVEAFFDSFEAETTEEGRRVRSPEATHQWLAFPRALERYRFVET